MFKNSHLYDHGTPMSLTEGRTDKTTNEHRAVKTD